MKEPEKWTDELKEYLIAHYADEPTKSISEKFNCEAHSIRTLAKRLHLRKSNPIWTEDKIDRLRELYPDHTNEEIAGMLGSTKMAVMAKGCELGLRKTKEFMHKCWMKSAFPKGHTPMNKGMKQNEYMSQEAIERTKATRFQKGSVPHNTRPVGSQRVDVDGYVMVKLPKGGFKAKHVVLWEEAHGKVPKGYMITFKDGDRRNFSLDNLEMISFEENMKRNSMRRYPEEVQKTIRLIGVLNRRINSIEKGKKW